MRRIQLATAILSIFGDVRTPLCRREGDGDNRARSSSVGCVPSRRRSQNFENAASAHGSDGARKKRKTKIHLPSMSDDDSASYPSGTIPENELDMSENESENEDSASRPISS